MKLNIFWVVLSAVFLVGFHSHRLSAHDYAFPQDSQYYELNISNHSITGSTPEEACEKFGVSYISEMGPVEDFHINSHNGIALGEGFKCYHKRWGGFIHGQLRCGTNDPDHHIQDEIGYCNMSVTPPPPTCMAGSGDGGGGKGSTGGSFWSQILGVSVGDPIVISSGQNFQDVTDWASSIDQRFNVSRIYRRPINLIDKSAKGFGRNWGFALSQELEFWGGETTLYMVSSGVYKFSGSGQAVPQSPGTHNYSLIRSTSSAVGSVHTVSDGSGVIQTYTQVSDVNALLTGVSWPDGYEITIDRDAGNVMTAMEDNRGQRAEFTWDATSVPGNTTPVITSIMIDTDYDSVSFAPEGALTYQYEIEGNSQYAPVLTSSELVDIASGEVREHYLFDYSDGNLTSIGDGRLGASGDPYEYATFEFAFDPVTGRSRAISVTLANGADRYEVGLPVGSADAYTVTVTNPLGKDTVYSFQGGIGNERLTNVEGIASSNCVASNAATTQSAAGRPVEVIERNGSRSLTTYDSIGRVLTSMRDADGANPQTATYTWPAGNLRKPLSVEHGGLKTSFTYDADGLVTSVAQEDVLAGSPDFGKVRTTTYGYTTLASGLKVITLVDGPGLPADGINDVSTFEYDAIGRVTKATNPNGLVEEVLAFDASGLPTLIKDHQGFQWALEYDLEGQLLKSTFAPNGVNESTTYTYDIIGQMISSTDSLGRTWTYTYDEARRLIEIGAPSGDTIAFNYNVMGNVTRIEYSDLGSVLTYLEQTQYDELGRILQAVGANGQTTGFTHDVEDNLSTMTDAIGFQTTNSYDALNRLTDIVDRASYTTSMEHDDLDQLTQFTDPRGIETQMVYNGFGDLLSEVSADRGTMSYSYDSRGLVTSMTDGRGVVMTYAYDDGGRITDKEFPSDPSLDQTFIYFPSTSTQVYNRGNLRLAYDQTGRSDLANHNDRNALRNDWRTIETIKYRLNYFPNGEGEITRLDYPSGSRALYTYDADGQVATVRWTPKDPVTGSFGATQNVMTGMTYLPFGPLKGAVYADGGVLTATYDTSYRLTGLSDVRAGVTLRDETYNWTTRDNLAGVTDNLDPLQSQNFTYTSREKLAGADGAWGEFDYGYDGVGNRTSLTSLISGTSTLDLYSYPPTSNRLQSIASGSSSMRTLTYDAAGNVTYDNRNGQGYGYTYDAANRMSSFAINGVVQAEYEYNYLGQQVVRRLTQAGQTIHSVHDAAGQRVAEYLFDAAAGTSSLIREYIWTNGTLVGVFENGQMYYVHTDQIGRPVFATDSTGAVIWDASYLPFGGVEASSGPNLDLRFPGQWFQSESGLHQNWMRDYDPTTGRYMQADPLGLVDGASVYGYATQNPGRYTDPRGEDSSSRGISIPSPLPPVFTPGTPEATELGKKILKLSSKYNPIDLFFQWCMSSGNSCLDDLEEEQSAAGRAYEICMKTTGSFGPGNARQCKRNYGMRMKNAVTTYLRCIGR